MNFDVFIKENLKPDMEPSSKLINQIYMQTTPHKAIVFRRIARFGIAVFFALFVVGATTIYAYNKGFLERPSQEVKYDCKNNYPDTFAIAIHKNTNDSISLQAQIASSDYCDSLIKTYLSSADLVIPTEDLNPEYLAYLQQEDENLLNFIQTQEFALIPVQLYTYEGAEDYVLYESIPETGATFYYTGSSEFYYEKGSTLRLKLPKNYGNATSIEQVPTTTIVLDSFSTTPEWFLDVAGNSFSLIVPYDEKDQLFSDTCTYFFCKAKKGFGKELRAEVSTILKNQGRIFEDRFFH